MPFGIVQTKLRRATFGANRTDGDVLLQQSGVYFAKLWNLPGKRDSLTAHTAYPCIDRGEPARQKSGNSFNELSARYAVKGLSDKVAVVTGKS